MPAAKAACIYNGICESYSQPAGVELITKMLSSAAYKNVMLLAACTQLSAAVKGSVNIQLPCLVLRQIPCQQPDDAAAAAAAAAVNFVTAAPQH